MNIIFWILVIVLLALVWVSLSWLFNRIGNFGKRTVNEIKNNIKGDNDNDDR